MLYGLEELEVRDCDSLEAVFDGKGLKSREILIKQKTQLKRFQQSDSMDENHDMIFQQVLFSIEKLSTKLEDLAINGIDAFRMLNGYCQENIFCKLELLHLQCFDETPPIFLNDFDAVFPNLITLTVRNSSFEILFPSKGSTGNRDKKISMQIKHLRLYDLEKIKYIFHEDFPSDHPLLQCLQDLSIRNCPSLISLVPSSTSFTNLTSLKVDNCKELVYLITSSTAKSLIQLTKLKIENCDKMLDGKVLNNCDGKVLNNCS